MLFGLFSVEHLEKSPDLSMLSVRFGDLGDLGWILIDFGPHVSPAAVSVYLEDRIGRNPGHPRHPSSSVIYPLCHRRVKWLFIRHPLDRVAWRMHILSDPLKSL